jgi:polysaccharide pyruvyl transferase WcaK-like protein
MRIENIKETVTFLFKTAVSREDKFAYIAGYNGHNNLGDEALYGAINTLFKPAKFINFPKKLKSELCFRFLSKFTCSVLAGGTIISGKLSTINFVKKSFHNCKNSIVFGSGVEDPIFWVNHLSDKEWGENLRKWKDILAGCKYVGVRGPRSAEILGDVRAANIDIIGDPVLIFAEDSIAEELNTKEKILGLNICETKGYMWGDIKILCEEYIRLASKAKDKGWQVRWFVLWPKDLKLTQQVATASKTDMCILQLYRDYNKYMQEVKKVSVFTGMRLHSVILAHCVYVPAIMLEYRPKCRDYMTLLELDEMTIKTDNASAGNIWEKIIFLDKYRETHRQNLYDKIKKIKEKQTAKATECKNFFEII